jgi:hypothetical protein
LVVLFSFTAAWATDGTCTVSYANVNSEVSTITWTWTASIDNATVPSTASGAVKGWVFMATTDPGATAPQALYDIVLNDSDSVDIFGAELNDRSATVSQHAVPKIGSSYYGPRFVNGTLTMILTNNNVNSATGILKIYYYREH